MNSALDITVLRGQRTFTFPFGLVADIAYMLRGKGLLFQINYFEVVAA